MEKRPWFRVPLRGSVDVRQCAAAVISFSEPMWVSAPLSSDFCWSHLRTAHSLTIRAVSSHRGILLQWLLLKGASWTSSFPLHLHGISMDLTYLSRACCSGSMAAHQGWQRGVTNNSSVCTASTPRSSQGPPSEFRQELKQANSAAMTLSHGRNRRSPWTRDLRGSLETRIISSQAPCFGFFLPGEARTRAGMESLSVYMLRGHKRLAQSTSSDKDQCGQSGKTRNLHRLQLKMIAWKLTLKPD